MALSIISRSAEDGRSITSPAAIRREVSGGRIRIFPIVRMIMVFSKKTKAALF